MINKKNKQTSKPLPSLLRRTPSVRGPLAWSSLFSRTILFWKYLSVMFFIFWYSAAVLQIRGNDHDGDVVEVKFAAAVYQPALNLANARALVDLVGSIEYCFRALAMAMAVIFIIFFFFNLIYLFIELYGFQIILPRVQVIYSTMYHNIILFLIEHVYLGCRNYLCMVSTLFVPKPH